MRQMDPSDRPHAWRLLPACAIQLGPAAQARAPTLWRPALPSPGELPWPAAPLPAYLPATAGGRNTRQPRMPMSITPPPTLVQRTGAGILSEKSCDLLRGFNCNTCAGHVD